MHFTALDNMRCFTLALHAMKDYMLILILCLFFAGCSEQTEPLPAARFTFSGTNLSFITPVNWFRTKIPSSNYLTIFTDIHYGIKPNIQLEYYTKEGDPQNALQAYIEKKKSMYADYTIIEKSQFQTTSGLAGLKIKARRENSDRTPVIHNTYVFTNNLAVFLIAATCAEPSLDLFDVIFDNAMRSVVIQ